MEWYQFLMLALGIYAMHHENQKNLTAFKDENRKVLDEIKNEQKDFHGRLCTLEERYLQILMSKKSEA